MRKLVLFGLLGGVFGLALLLEHFVTRPTVRVANDSDQLAIVIGGGPARELPPEIPPTPPADPAANDGRRASPRPAARPDEGGARGGNEASAKSRPPASPPPSDVSAPRDHVVEKGETLESIAKAELGAATRWKDLAAWNGIDDPQRLKIGTRLRMSAPDNASQKAPSPPNSSANPGVTERTHKFAKGDTLSHLAAIYLGDAGRWREIQRLNGIADAAKITEGTVLQLPPR